ncbi:TIGR04255 family protein [Pseudonocardia sp. N23]|uniref:TIGR04255 family protein n=1 Tax=Pseudonocardia sp. N23 TaxID=1987376 RepID=UPI0021117684|nr:TIGR04255 family protein [Pseudonocardia sp. N23]
MAWGPQLVDEAGPASRRDASRDDLVGFRNPPVVEVVAAVRFDDLPPTEALALAEFWRARLADTFPNFAVQPPYSAPVEQFDQRFGIPDFSLDLSSIPPPVRMWLSNATGDELVQLQPNWMACNWRKVSPDATYGRWQARRRQFEQIFGDLHGWLRLRGTPLSANQCEVTYINHIRPEAGLWNSHSEAHRIFVGIGEITPAAGVRVEQTESTSQFIFDAVDGGIGRLHIKVQPAFDQKDGSPIFVTELTARGAPPEPSLAGVLAFLDAARGAVVTMFSATTTVEAQARWGRE